VLNHGTNADIVATNVGNIFLPQTPETFGYDADGSLTNSGRWTITWDAENRALSFASLASAPLASQKKVDCAYDFQGRRIQKIVSTNSGPVWIPIYTNRYVYDGWNLVAILNPQSSILQSFMWGMDLSGSSQGAGGVGGLLSMTVYESTNAGSYLYCFDGNGNVSALVNAANGTTVGQYEYGPFGEVIRATGPMAKANPFRFSTKYQDDESDLLYYGYRYYKASTGTWLSRDPLGERGGANLYAFVGNNSMNYYDKLGLEKIGAITDEVKEIENKVHNIYCCCNKYTSVTATLGGTAAGTTVTDTVSLNAVGCKVRIWEYWWWNCFRAQKEAAWDGVGWFGGDAWKEYGWETGGPTDTETHEGGPHDAHDADHWNWQAILIITYCSDADHHLHAKAVMANQWEFNWDQKTKAWISGHDPLVGGR
jgi:RHS repeat-associated protein